MQFGYGLATALRGNDAQAGRGDLSPWAGWAQAQDGIQPVRGALPRQHLILSFLLVLTLVAVVSLCGLTQQAAAQDLDSLQAHLGSLRKKPKALPLAQAKLQLSHTEGTASYMISTPRSATGITLVVNGDTSSKVTVERYNAPDGKKLKHKAWSRKQGSKRLHVLSFDGLGFGENTIGISLNVPKNPELSKTYNVTITRAETLGSDATLTALGLSQSGLTPVFASDTKSYTADVPYRVTSLGITVQRKQAGTAIRLRGTASDGTGLVVEEMTASGLTVGRNMIEILATAEDGSMTESYTVAVLRLAPSKDTKLRDLSLAEGPAGFFGLDIPTGGGILRPAFSPDTRSYEASVPSHVIAVKMAILSQTISALRQSGRQADGTALAVRTADLTFDSMKLGDITVRDLRRRIVTFSGLQAGGNTIEIQVTAEDGVTTGAYKVTVTRDGVL